MRSATLKSCSLLQYRVAELGLHRLGYKRSTRASEKEASTHEQPGCVAVKITKDYHKSKPACEATQTSAFTFIV